MFHIRDGSRVNDLTKKASWPDRWHISVKLNITKKLAHGLGDPSDGLHDPPLERINWNAVTSWQRTSLTRNQTLTFTMTGCNALSIELIKPTEEQATVSSQDTQWWKWHELKYIKWIIFWTVDKDMKVTSTVEWTTQVLEKEPEKIQAWPLWWPGATLYPLNLTSQLESRSLWVRNMPDGGNDRRF